MFPELGDAPAWTQEELAALNARNIEYNGKLYTQYEISQMQRARERNVRKWKKRYLAETATGALDEEEITKTAVRLRAAREELKHFVSSTGGRLDSSRTSTAKFGRSEASKASAKSQTHHTEWLKSINAQGTSLNTVAKYYDAKYNNTEEYQLLMHYNHSVETGWLSPLAGFDLYKSTHERIQTELVGQAAANGTVITGHTAHFMERMFGTLVDPKKLKQDLKIIRRSGTDFEDVKDTLMNPVMPPKTRKDVLGRNSTVFFGKNAQVSVNDKGELIQCEPKKRGDQIGKNE